MSLASPVLSEVSPHCVLIALFGSSGRYLWSTVYKHCDIRVLSSTYANVIVNDIGFRLDSMLASDSETEYDLSPCPLTNFSCCIQ